jgi:hypothetical protein
MEKLSEVFVWPLAVVLIAIACLLIFRSPIANLINRIRRVSYGNKSVDVDGGQATIAVEKQKEPNAAATIAARDTIPASHMKPAPNEVYAPFEQRIRAALTAANLPYDLEKDWLIREVATVRVQRIHEINYRLVLGTQLSLMLQYFDAPNDGQGAGNLRASEDHIPGALSKFRVRGLEAVSSQRWAPTNRNDGGRYNAVPPNSRRARLPPLSGRQLIDEPENRLSQKSCLIVILLICRWSSSARRLPAHPASGTTTISTCLRTAKLSVASIRPMRGRSARPGCGRSRSGTTKVARRPTATRRRGGLRWRRSPRVGGGNRPVTH